MSEAHQASARWAKAAARADGLADLGIAGAVRRYYLVPFPVVVLISLGVAFFVVLVWPPEQRDILLAGLSLGMMLAGLASGIAGLVYGSKKIGPKVQPRGVGVTAGLTTDEVKRVRRQVLGKEPADADRTVLRGAAIQLREGLARQLVTLPPFALCLWGQATHRGLASAVDVVMAAALLLYMVALGYSVRQFQQAGAFLTMTSVSASADPA